MAIKGIVDDSFWPWEPVEEAAYKAPGWREGGCAVVSSHLGVQSFCNVTEVSDRTVVVVAGFCCI